MVSLKKKYRINRNRPTIGITGPDKGGEAAWLFTAFGVLLAGGKPVRITPKNPRTADGLQALIIGGGADVDPRAYQQEEVLDEYLKRTLKHPRKNIFQRIGRFTRWLYYPALFMFRRLFSRKAQGWTIDRDRDHLEFQLIHQAVKKNLPILGICRGSQLMNVYFGGTLYQEIGGFYLEEPNPHSIFPVKKIRVKPDSKLAQILGVQQLKVNAIHHQAVKDPGENMRIVAKEANLVVQATEHIIADFILGVQWHPEYLPSHKEQRRIFQALVHHARQVHKQIEDIDMQEALSTPRNPTLEALEDQEEEILQEEMRKER